MGEKGEISSKVLELHLALPLRSPRHVDELLLGDPPFARQVKGVDHLSQVPIGERRIDLCADGTQAVGGDAAGVAGVEESPGLLGGLGGVAAGDEPGGNGLEGVESNAEADGRALLRLLLLLLVVAF